MSHHSDFEEQLFERLVEDPDSDGGLSDAQSRVEQRNFLRHILSLAASKLADGLVDEATIDLAVRRVLTAKFAAGLFEQPFVDEATTAAILDEPAHRDAAQDAAERSLRLSQGKLRIGSLDQLSLLSVQRSWVASRDSRAQSRFDSLQSGLTLYKALGGGWQQ